MQRNSVFWLTMGLLLAASAGAQQGEQSGVTGRVIVDRGFNAAATIPVDERRADWVKTSSRIRRPAGHGELVQPTEPAPEFVVVLEGRRGTAGTARVLTFEGMRFSPATLLAVGGQPLKIENKADFPITVKAQGGDVVAEVPANGSTDASLADGEYVLRVDQLPFARAEVRAIGDAQVLPIAANGRLPVSKVPEGSYKIAFYHGARPLKVETLEVPDAKLMAVDAKVSAKGVVTLEVKDASLQVATPVRRAPPPPQ